MNLENIKLEKHMYYNPNKTFSQILEELDPSENYDNSYVGKLDAYQRQLKRFDIKVNGKNCDYISKFYENSYSAVLFPEFVARCIAQGMHSNSILQQIVANTNKINTLNYQNVQLNNLKSNILEPVEEFQEIPETQLKPNKEFVKLIKRGCFLSASYETIEFQKIDSFSIALKQIGRCIIDSIIKDAIFVLLAEKEKKDEQSPTVTSNKEGEITYEDLVNVWTQFEEFEMNTIIIHPTLLAKMANINEFKNPLSKFSFQNNGNLTTPLGANIIKTCAAPKDSIIFLDKNFALSQLIAKEITVEADKLIEKQITRTVIYTIVGFAKMFKKACCILKLKK